MGKKYAGQIRGGNCRGGSEEKTSRVDRVGAKRTRSCGGSRVRERSDKKKTRRKRRSDVDEANVSKTGRDFRSEEDPDGVIEEAERMNEAMSAIMETVTVQPAEATVTGRPRDPELVNSYSSSSTKKSGVIQIVIEHRKWYQKRRRSKLLVGGRFVSGDAYLEYVHRTGTGERGQVDIVHTYVPPHLRGRGIAMHLVDAAYAFASLERFSVVPTCTYVSDTYLPRRRIRISERNRKR